MFSHWKNVRRGRQYVKIIRGHEVGLMSSFPDDMLVAVIVASSSSGTSMSGSSSNSISSNSSSGLNKLQSMLAASLLKYCLPFRNWQNKGNWTRRLRYEMHGLGEGITETVILYTWAMEMYYNLCYRLKQLYKIYLSYNLIHILHLPSNCYTHINYDI